MPEKCGSLVMSCVYEVVMISIQDHVKHRYSKYILVFVFLLIMMAFQNRTWTSPISQLSVDLFCCWERPSPLYCHSLLARLPFNQKEMAASSLKLGGKGKFWDISLALQKFYAKHFCNLFHKAPKLEPYCCCTIYYDCLKLFTC